MSRAYIVLLLLCLGFKASAQQSLPTSQSSPLSTYYGGAGVAGPAVSKAADPSVVPSSFRGYILGNDPFAGYSYDECVGKAQTAFRASQLSRSGSNDPTQAAASAAGAALATVASSGKGQSVLGSGLDAAASGGLTSCPAAAPKLTSADSCAEFKRNEKFDPSAIDELIKEANSADQIALCRQRNGTMAAAIAQCVNDEFTHIKDAMREVKKDFDADLQTKNGYQSYVNDLIQKNTTQKETLDGKVASYRDTLDKAQKLYGKGNDDPSKGVSDSATVSGLEQGLQAQKDRDQKLATDKKVYRVRLAQSCITGPGAKFGSTLRGRCKTMRSGNDAGGNNITPLECLRTFYGAQAAQNLTGSNRKIGVNDPQYPAVQQAINNWDSSVADALSVFEGESAKSTSVASAEGLLRSKLSQFGAFGGYLIKELQACDADAERQIKDELANNTGVIGTQAKDTAKAAAEVAAKMRAKLIGTDGLDLAVRDVGKAVFNRELNEYFTAYNCTAAVSISNSQESGAPGKTTIGTNDLATQFNCIKNLDGLLFSMINGTVPPGSKAPLQVDLPVPGPDGALQKCQGLRDCLKKSEDTSAAYASNLSLMKGTGSFKDLGGRCGTGQCPGLQKFVHDANTNRQKAVQEAAEMFNRRVGVLKVQFESAKTQFGNLGGLTFPDPKAPDSKGVSAICPADGKDLCTLEDGPNFEDTLGKLAGLPNISGDAFTDAKKAAQDVATEGTTSDNDIKKQLAKLKKFKSSCKDEDTKEKRVAGISKVTAKYQEALAECQENASQGDPAAEEFANNLRSLSEDLTRVCETSPDTDCSRLQAKLKRTKPCTASIEAAKDSAEQKLLLRQAFASGAGQKAK